MLERPHQSQTCRFRSDIRVCLHFHCRSFSSPLQHHFSVLRVVNTTECGNTHAPERHCDLCLMESTAPHCSSSAPSSSSPMPPGLPLAAGWLAPLALDGTPTQLVRVNSQARADKLQGDTQIRFSIGRAEQALQVHVQLCRLPPSGKAERDSHLFSAVATGQAGVFLCDLGHRSNREAAYKVLSPARNQASHFCHAVSLVSCLACPLSFGRHSFCLSRSVMLEAFVHATR